VNAPPLRRAPRLRRPAEQNDNEPVSVLLLHGMGGGVSGWNDLCALLPAHLELWDVDLPWSLTGEPAWARDPEVTQWVSVPVEDLRRALGRGPDIIVAHSFAANLILELLAGTDLLEFTPTVLVSPFHRGTQADLDWPAVIPSMENCYAEFFRLMRNRRRNGGDIDVVMARRLCSLMGTYAPLRFYEVYRRTPELALESLTAPVLLVGGSADIGASVDGIRLLSKRIPEANMAIIDGCGHFPMSENAPELARLIENFIDQCLPGLSHHQATETPP
jgi:pimeloyl-ACP methyl ester carboxylesterase